VIGGGFDLGWQYGKGIGQRFIPAPATHRPRVSRWGTDYKRSWIVACDGCRATWARRSWGDAMELANAHANRPFS
jgi:hypothetical protein